MVANFGKCRTAVFLASALAILATVSVCVGGGFGADLARMSVTTVGGGVPAAAPSGAAFSDNFNRADNDSLGSNWTEAVGDADIASNALYFATGGWDPVLVSHNTSTNTVNQYVKISIPVANETYGQVVFRYTNSSTHFYTVAFNTPFSCEIEWRHVAGSTGIGAENTIGTSVDMGSCSNGDSFGITITGTGDDTVVRVWHNPTANTPVSASEWDSGDTTPDASWTTNPGANAVDTGNKVGFAGIQNSAGEITFDSFYAGDIP